MGYLNDYYSGTGTKRTTSSSSGGYLQQYRTQQKNVKVTDNKKTTTSKKTPTESKKIGDYLFSFKQPDYRTGYQKYQDILGIAKGTTDYGGAKPKQEDQIVVKPKQKKLTDSQMRTLDLLNKGEDRVAGQSAGLSLATQQAITDYYKPENLEKERQRIRTEVQLKARDLPADYQEPGTIGYAIDAIKLGTVGLASSLGATVELFGNMSELVGVTKIGQELQKKADTVIAQNPEWQPDPNEKWGGKKVARLVAGAVPSLLAVVATTLATGGIGGVAVAFSLEGGSAYKEAVEADVEEKEAQKKGLLVGSINAILERVFPSSLRKGGDEAVEQISKSLYKNLKNQAVKFGVKFTKDGILEGSTEATQQVVANAVAQSYDDDRKLWDGMLESFVGGFGSAGLIGAVNDATRGGNKEQALASIKKDIEEGNQDPDAVIGQVIANGVQDTPEGKEIIKFALEAKEQGATLEVESQLKDKNRELNERNTQRVAEETESGAREDRRLSNEDQLNIAKKYKANNLSEDVTPDTVVTVYRASDKEAIEKNEQVTLDEANAQRYVEQREGAQLRTAEVPLRDLVFADGLKSEFIYAPQEQTEQVEKGKQVPKAERAKDYASAEDFAKEAYEAQVKNQIGYVDPNTIEIRDEVGYGTPEYESLKADIQRVGIIEPVRVTVEKDGAVLTTDGSQRTAIARELGIEVPIIVNSGTIDGLSTIEEVYGKNTETKQPKKKVKIKQSDKSKMFNDIVELVGEKEVQERLRRYDNVDDFVDSFSEDIKALLNPVNKEVAPEEVSPEQQRIRQTLSEEVFRDILDKHFAIISDFYAERNITTTEEYLEKVDPDIIALEVDSNRNIYEQLIETLGGDELASEISFEQVISEYKNGKLPPSISKESFKYTPENIKDFEGELKQKFYQTAIKSKIKNPQKTYETAKQRVTKKNAKKINKARKDIFLLWSLDPNAHEQLGVTRAELNKQMRSWTSTGVGDVEAQQRANEGVPERFAWTGITNSSYIYKADFSTSDVDAVVKNIKTNNTNFNQPDGDQLRRYIANTLFSIDTRMKYDDLSFNVKTLDGALGTFNSQDIEITIDNGMENTVAHEIGHYIDYRFAREIGLSTTPLSSSTPNYDYLKQRYNLSNEHIQWAKDFRQFLFSLREKGETSGSSKRAEYLQTPTEIFARFVAKFVDWTAESSGYKSFSMNHYSDRFSNQDFYNFIHLMQKKAEIDVRYGVKPLVKGSGGVIEELRKTQLDTLRGDLATYFKENKKSYRGRAVPREQLPVKTKGKKKVSRLEARVKKLLDKASPEQVEELGLAKYNEMNKEENIAQAVEFVKENPDKALEVLAGNEQPPKGILTNSIYIAMERLAQGDITLARRLASLRSTRLGQEISILTELDPDSAVRYMKEVIRVREQVFDKRYKKRSQSEVTKKTVESIKKSIKKPGKSQWSNFLNEIKC